MITYEDRTNTEIRVYLEKRLVGKIKGSSKEGYWYEPMHAAPGETFATIEEVKCSLESE